MGTVGLSLLWFSQINMATNKKKTRKLRGHVSHGHGRIGKHRKHPSGRGNAGGDNHQRINYLKYHPGRFGKDGMRYLREHQNRDWTKAINVDKLWSLLGQQTFNKYKGGNSKVAPVIDVVACGYQKVL